MAQTIVCPACHQEQSVQRFCSFCYAPFAAGPQIKPAPSEQIVQAETPLPAVLRLLFSYSAISPLVWFSLFVLSAVMLVVSAIDLIPASFPHWLIVLLTSLSAWLTHVFYKRYFPALARDFQGGLMPSFQKALVSLGLFCLLGAGFYLFWLNHILGVIALLGVFGYSFFYLKQGRQRQSLAESWQNLIHSTERIEAPGIHIFEKISLCLCLVCFMLGSLASLDMLLVTGHPVYAVRLLGKEVHSGGKGGPSYWITLSGWHGSSRVSSQQVSGLLYDRLIPAADYQLKTRRGLLGTERIESFTIAPREPLTDSSP